MFKFHPSAFRGDSPPERCDRLAHSSPARDRQLGDVAQFNLFDARDPHRFFTIPVNCFLRGYGQQFFAGCLLTVLRATLCFHQCPSPTCPQLAFSIRHLGLTSSPFAVHCRWPLTTLTSWVVSFLDSGLVQLELLSRF